MIDSKSTARCHDTKKALASVRQVLPSSKQESDTALKASSLYANASAYTTIEPLKERNF